MQSREVQGLSCELDLLYSALICTNGPYAEILASLKENNSLEYSSYLKIKSKYNFFYYGTYKSHSDIEKGLNKLKAELKQSKRFDKDVLELYKWITYLKFDLKAFASAMDASSAHPHLESMLQPILSDLDKLKSLLSQPRLMKTIGFFLNTKSIHNKFGLNEEAMKNVSQFFKSVSELQQKILSKETKPDFKWRIHY